MKSRPPSASARKLLLLLACASRFAAQSVRRNSIDGVTRLNGGLQVDQVRSKRRVAGDLFDTSRIRATRRSTRYRPFRPVVDLPLRGEPGRSEGGNSIDRGLERAWRSSRRPCNRLCHMSESLKRVPISLALLSLDC